MEYNTEYFVFPLNFMFANFTNDIGNNYINAPMRICITLQNPLLFQGQMYYFQSKFNGIYTYVDKNGVLLYIGDIHLNFNTVSILLDHKDKIRRYISEQLENGIDLIGERIQKINNEKHRIQNIEHFIRNTVIYNLNLKELRNDHYTDILNKCKINVNKNNTKTLFLYMLLLEMKDSDIILINDYINRILNLNLDIFNDINNLKNRLDMVKPKNKSAKNTIKNKIDYKYQELFVYFSICKIIKIIHSYISYLNICISTLNKDAYNYSPELMFNDVLNNKVETKDIPNKHNEREIHFKDTNINAIDISATGDKFKSTGFVLAFTREKRKWNIYPEKSKKDFITESVFDNYVYCIEQYNNEGFNHLQYELT
jgi:hypothetical protein